MTIRLNLKRTSLLIPVEVLGTGETIFEVAEIAIASNNPVLWISTEVLDNSGKRLYSRRMIGVCIGRNGGVSFI